MSTHSCTREGRGAYERRAGGTKRSATHLWWRTGLLRSRRAGHTGDTVPLPLSLHTQHPNVRSVQLARTQVRASIPARAKLEPVPIDNIGRARGKTYLVVNIPPLSPVRHCRSSTRPVSPKFSQTAYRAACRARCRSWDWGTLHSSHSEETLPPQGSPQTRSLPTLSVPQPPPGTDPAAMATAACALPKGAQARVATYLPLPARATHEPEKTRQQGAHSSFQPPLGVTLTRIPLGPRVGSYPSRTANR